MVIEQKKMSEGYKTTDLGEIPISWNVLTLNELAYKILDGTHATPTYVESGIKFLSVENITNNNYEKTKYVSPEAHAEYSKRCKVENNDILMTRIGSIGNAKLVDWNFESSIYVSLALIKLKKKEQAKFISHYMKSSIFKKEILKRALLNAAPQKINLGDIGKVSVILPTIKEQQKIAEILSAADEQIEKTNQLIEKTKELKKGLMQQLLSKGIGHTKFKQTDFGEIPVEWNLSTLGDSCKVIMGQSPKGDTYNNEGIGLPLLNGPTEFGDKYPMAIQWTSTPTKLCEKGDILFCVRGSSIGRMNISNDIYCIGRGLAAIRQSDNTITSYISYLMDYQVEKVLKNSSGSTFPNITRDELINVFLPIPTLYEQQKITKILASVDELIEVYEKEKVKQVELKKALMQQLFTGKLRVTV